jgi:hypothetical protein
MHKTLLYVMEIYQIKREKLHKESMITLGEGLQRERNLESFSNFQSLKYLSSSILLGHTCKQENF